MATNEGSFGKMLQDFIAPAGGATTSVPLNIEDTLCVPQVTVLVGATFVGQTEGIVTNMVKAAGFTTAVGQAAYFDEAAAEWQGTDSATNRLGGKFVTAELVGSLLCSVKLEGKTYAAGNQDLEDKADKAIPGAAGNVAGLNASGNLTDTGVAGDDLLEAAADATAATQVMVSGGADRSVDFSEMSIEAADGASQGASPVFANTSDAFTFKILTPDAPGANVVLIADEIVAGKFVQVTFVGGNATAASAADPDLAGGQVISCIPVSTSDQALQSAELQGDGSVIVTTMVAQTGAAVYNLIVERG